jgi:hypothetical protein
MQAVQGRAVSGVGGKGWRKASSIGTRRAQARQQLEAASTGVAPRVIRRGPEPQLPVSETYGYALAVDGGAW